MLPPERVQSQTASMEVGLVGEGRWCSSLDCPCPILGNSRRMRTHLLISQELPINCTGFLPTLIIPGQQEQLINASSSCLPNLNSTELTQLSPGESMPGGSILPQVKISALSAATKILTWSLRTKFGLFGNSWNHLASGDPAFPWF